MVRDIPEQILTWMVDSAVVIAVNEGAISEEEAKEYMGCKCQNETNVREVVKEVQV